MPHILSLKSSNNFFKYSPSRDKKNTSLTSIEINDFLGLKGIDEYTELEKVLDKLCEEGKIYYSEKKKRYTPIENTNFKTGK